MNTQNSNASLSNGTMSRDKLMKKEQSDLLVDKLRQFQNDLNSSTYI
jgi:hypothetical protein